MTGLYEKVLTRKYDHTGSLAGRSTGLTLGTGYDLSYSYDENGCFETLGWEITQSGTLHRDTATYAYLPTANLVETLTTYTYEPHRNLKTGVTNAFDTTQISTYGYTYDKIGRRTSVAHSGLAFSEPGFNTYQYNGENRLTAVQPLAPAENDTRVTFI